MPLDDLTIGEARKLAQMFDLHQFSSEQDRGVCIVILHRGFVAVGHLYLDVDEFRLEKAAIVRRWGTTKGLGELAATGPLKETILDDCGTLRAHRLTTVATIDCCESNWHDRS